MALFNNNKTFPWSIDYDSRERGCTIKLMVRDIDGSVAEHWALYFEWTDHGSATYEANDDDGYLIPTWKRGKPDAFYSWRVGESFERRCSPRDVNSRARQIDLNGQLYLLTDRNCHHWATELASKFGINLSKAIESLLPDDLKRVIDFGYCVNNLTNFLSLTDSALAGSTRASESGHARTLIPTGSHVASTSLRASNAVDEYLMDPPSDPFSARERANARNSRAAFASASQVSARTLDDRRNANEDSPIQTAMAIGGAVAFAGFAFATLLKNISDEGEKTSERSKRNNRSFLND